MKPEPVPPASLWKERAWSVENVLGKSGGKAAVGVLSVFRVWRPREHVVVLWDAEQGGSRAIEDSPPGRCDSERHATCRVLMGKGQEPAWSHAEP